MFRRRTDWTPTFQIAIAALTAYVVYLSLKVDRLVQAASRALGDQEARDEEAAKDREELHAKQDAQRTRSTQRTRRITYALTIMGIVVAVLAIPEVFKFLEHVFGGK